MGLALEVIAGQATNIGAGPTNLPAVAQSTLTVRNARLDSRVLLLQAWGDFQVAGFAQIRSPKLHDNVRGIRVNVSADQAVPKLPDRFKQMVVPQDVLIFEGSSVDAAGDIETLAALLWYEDLAGTAARLLNAQEVYDRTVSVVTVSQTLATGALGGFSGEEALNAESDLLKANTDYALLGYDTDANGGGVFWRGVDTGNLRVGGPSLIPGVSETVTRNWFLNLATMYQLPMVPVFNSANKGGILVDALQDENGVDIFVQAFFAELAPGR